MSTDCGGEDDPFGWYLGFIAAGGVHAGPVGVYPVGREWVKCLDDLPDLSLENAKATTFEWPSNDWVSGPLTEWVPFTWDGTAIVLGEIQTPGNAGAGAYYTGHGDYGAFFFAGSEHVSVGAGGSLQPAYQMFVEWAFGP